MPHRLSIHRLAAVFLALSLLLGTSSQTADADGLGRGQSHGAAFVTVGNESDGFDGSRFIRRVCSAITYHNSVLPASSPKLYWLRTVGDDAGAPSRLHRLNVVFLI
jgi:hypothetical protein